jgi:small conductance mechanosensitive channel
MLLLVVLPVVGAAQTDEQRDDQQLLVQELRELERRARELSARVPEQTGLTQRISRQRVERLWSQIAGQTQRLAETIAGLDEVQADTVAAIRELAPIIDARIGAGIERVRAELDSLTLDEASQDAVALARVYNARRELYTHLIELLTARANNAAIMQAHVLDRALVDKALAEVAKDQQSTAFELSLALEVATTDARAIDAQVKNLPGNQDLQAIQKIVHERIMTRAENLREVAALLEQSGGDVTEYREQITLATGQISEDLLDHKLLVSLASETANAAREWLAENALSLVAQTLGFVLILLIFWGLSRLASRLVERAMQSERVNVSTLLQDLSCRFVANIVLALGFMVALSQVGVSIGPLLAGLGVAGFVLGFALQDSLSNFASGVMILFYRPFDVGDIVETGSVLGTVKSMSLVNTTILTFDNQTLMIPNSKIWGDVIKNVTAQTERRVDMTFGIAYSDDVDKAEEVLTEIVRQHELILDEPAPIVKLHELGDSSVNFVVRPWVKSDDYWPVYWDVTRAVKRRFDEEGISIPFPQRDVHLIQQHAPGVNADA